MKQIDYLKLVSTARRSSYFAHPTEEDEALKNLILIGGSTSLGLTFAAAILVSWLGASIEANHVGAALAWTILPAIYFSVVSMFLGGARRLVLYAMAVPALALSVTLAALMLRGLPGHWLIYLPPLAFLTVMSWVTFRQVSLIGGDAIGH